MTGPIRAEVVRWEPTGIADIDLAVARWRPSSLVPDSFKDTNGNVRMDDLGLAACICYDLGVSPRVNLPYVYVVKGVVRLMATLQRALAARAGWDLQEVETGPKACAWRIRPAGCACPEDACTHWKGTYRMTWDMAVKAGWADKDTYKKMPEAMLSARACTWLLDRYAPGVKLGIESAVAGRGVVMADDVEGTAPAPVGEVRAVAPPPEYRDDGSTIPAHARQPPADDDYRASLIARLDALELRAPQALAALRETIAPAKIPNLRHGGPEFKLAHAMLLDRLFADIEADLVPPSVHDDAPEATSSDPDHGYRYEPADGAPFPPREWE